MVSKRHRDMKPFSWEQSTGVGIAAEICGASKR